MTRMNRLAICLSIAGLALAACGSDPDPDTAGAATKTAKPAPADPLARMAQAGRHRQAGAGVLNRLRLSAEAAGGQAEGPAPVFIPQAGVDSLDIMVSALAMDGVTLSGPQTASFPDVVP